MSDEQKARSENVRCGRIDEHKGHYWSCPQLVEHRLTKVEYWCPGKVVIEGGSRA